MPALTQQESSYLFPVAQGEALPLIGQGFNLIGATSLAISAFDPPASAEMNVNARENSNAKYFAIYDNETFDQAIQFDFETSGGGWGVQTGMSVSASARLDSVSTTFSVHLNAAKTTSQAEVKASTALSSQASADLKSLGSGGFVLKYGSHFVAGYVYGKACKASYYMSFQSLDMKLAFTTTYTESGTEVGFSDSTKATLSSLTAKSQTTCSTSVEANCTGFDGNTPTTFDDLIKLAALYDQSTSSDATAVSLIVLPWSYLDQVSACTSGLNLDSNSPLITLMNDLNFITGSCNNFIAEELYVGNTQLQNVRQVGADAAKELDSLNTLLSACAASGTHVVVEDGAQLTVNGNVFAYSQPLLDRLNFAISHFAIDWKTSVSGGSRHLQCDLKNLDGTPVQVSADGYSVAGTTYFTWSIDGNAGWAGTSGTQSMSYRLSYFGDDFWNMAIVLDRKAGTIQLLARGANQSLDQNPRSHTLPIRGVDNTRHCNDPANTSALVWDKGEANGGYMWVSPI